MRSTHAPVAARAPPLHIRLRVSQGAHSGLIQRQFAKECSFFRECGRRQRSDGSTPDAGPIAFIDDALLDCLFEHNHRKVTPSAFNASPQLVQKLISELNFLE